MPKKLDLTDNLEKYIIEHSDNLTNIQKEILDYNFSLGDQKKLQISISQAQFLQTLIKISNIKKVLEIGSFTGFSALSMALSLPDDGSLISLDKNSEFSKKAKFFYDKANENKITQIIKPALESLKELENSKQKFDLVFIDADKENYINYYEKSIEMIDKNGTYYN
jgi:predicted O-methyltransferase YrrM